WMWRSCRAPAPAPGRGPSKPSSARSGGFAAAASVPGERAALSSLYRLPGDQIEVSVLQRGLLRLGIGRQLVRHGPAADALAGVHPRGDVQPLLQRLILLPQDAHMAGRRLDQLLR